MSGEEYYRPPFLDLMEAIFCTALYESFKQQARAEGQIFTVSRGKFIHDISLHLDRQYAQQQNGDIRPREPLIKYAYR